MEPESITKEFACRKHPTEKIQRFSAINSSSVLYCIDCLLAIEDKKTKDAVLPIKEFIQNAVANFEKIQSEKTLKGDPPTDLLEALDKEDETISKISEYIKAEKAKVENSFEELKEIFNSLCKKAKQDISMNLDNQLLNFRYNYRYCKEKLNKYSGKQTENSVLTAERGIVSSMNKCESAADLEFLVTQINDEISENKVFDNFVNRTKGMEHLLYHMADLLKFQGENLPKTHFSEPKRSQKAMETFRHSMSKIIRDASYIKNEIVNFSLYSLQSTLIDSKILTNLGELEMIKKWLVKKNPLSIKLKLLLRGTRDGFDVDTFHKKCDNIKNTLVLVKTEFGKVCGGFTRLDWTPVSNQHKQDSKAFLFSVDHKSKFNVRYLAYSIYPHVNYLPTFGGGPYDLHLANNCNTNQLSCSVLGTSYGPNGFCTEDEKYLLTGGFKFKVIEYEVFEVEGY